ncbi:MAG: hypothetical protein WAM66_09545 [Acidobacteriaceae bacterium]
MSAVKWKFEDESSPRGKGWESEQEHPETDVALDEALKSAEKLMTVDWDEDEPTILKPAFDRAKTFLLAQSHQMKKGVGCFPPPPRISPGPSGSADLHWDGRSGEMLVNIPVGQAPATYYGESVSTSPVKGSFDPNSWHLGIYTWLSKE